MSRVESEVLARRCLLVLVAAVLAVALLVALTVPYHATDSLAYGEWSRRIGLDGGFHYPTIGSGFLARPLFYVLQGQTWNVLGFHEWIGRLESLGFGAGLVALVMVLARASVRTAMGALAAAVAGGCLIATPDVVQNLSSGQTDLPVAALLAAVGVLLWTGTPARWRPPLIALAALGAQLSKPSAVAALAGIGAATLLGPVAEMTARVVRQTVPLAVGTAAGLVYDLTQAHHDGLGLYNFLTGTLPGVSVVDQTRQQFSDAHKLGDTAQVSGALGKPKELLAMQWLGPFLVALLAFGLAYGVLRALGLRHRLAALAAAVVSFALTWIGPLVTGYDGPWHNVTVALPCLLVAVPFALAARVPDEEAPDRLTLARLVVWVLPVVAAWTVASTPDTRLLSPAWPAVFALVAGAVATAITGAGKRHVALAVAVVVAVGGIALYDTRNLDSLGTTTAGSADAWSALAHAGPSGLLHRQRMLEVADPEQAAIRAAVLQRLGPHGRLFTSDARFRYLLLDRVTRGYAARCSELRGYRVFLLLTDPTLRGFTPTSLDPGDWARCRDPRLTQGPTVPNRYAIFTITP